MKKHISLALTGILLISLMSGCGAVSSSSNVATLNNSTSAAPSATIEAYNGENAFEACDWAAENFPNAKVIRYTNNTSSGTFYNNGGSIPAEALYLAVHLPLETDGRYRLELYADGQLAKTVDDIVSGLKSGAFEMNCLTSGNFASYTNAFAEINVPFMFNSQDQMMAALDAGLEQDMLNRAEADIDGILFTGVAPLGFRQLTNNVRSIQAPADVKGLKLRTMTDPIQVAAWEALGATVTSVTYSELYTALQQGVVDGEENPFQNLVVDKLGEVQKHCTVTNHLYSLSITVVSKSWFEKLPTEDQEIISRLMKESEQAGWARVSELTDYYRSECEKTGMEILELDTAQLDAFKTVMKESVYNACVDSMGQDRWDALNNYVK